MRIVNEKLFIEVAKLFADRSTCSRKHVGAVITRDDRIVATGYNGVPSGREHCLDFFIKYHKDNNIKLSFDDWIKTPEFLDLHKNFSVYEFHAEFNLISFCTKNNISTLNSVLFTTLSPCLECSKLISNVGIKEVIYLEEYDRSIEGIKFLKDLNIICRKFNEQNI